MLRQPLQPAAAAAAIDEKKTAAIKKYFSNLIYCGFFYCDDHLRIWLESIAAIIEECRNRKRLLRHSSIAAPATVAVRGAAIRALLYGPAPKSQW